MRLISHVACRRDDGLGGEYSGPSVFAVRAIVGSGPDDGQLPGALRIPRSQALADTMGTPQEQDALERGIAAIEAFATIAVSRSSEASIEWNMHVVRSWTSALDPAADAVAVYEAALAIPSESYMPEQDHLRELVKALRKAADAGPLAHTPAAAFPADQARLPQPPPPTAPAPAADWPRQLLIARMRRAPKSEVTAQIEATAHTWPGGCAVCAMVSPTTGGCERIAENDHAVCALDRFPSRHGHLVIALRRHVESIAALSWLEYSGMQELAFRACRTVEATLHPARTFVASLGSAQAGGISFPHAHVHVIPLADGGESDRPAAVFTWSNGVYIYEDDEARALAASLRAAWAQIEI